jgi:hypothetical protein
MEKGSRNTEMRRTIRIESSGKKIRCYFLSIPSFGKVREEKCEVIYRMLQEESVILGGNFP